VSYEAVVFAGGGCRCFWQAGFWAEAAEAVGLQPKAIAAVSAGAAFACAAIGGKTDAVLSSFKRRTAENPSNFHFDRLRQRRSPFPHHEMYRGTILETTDEGMLDRLRDGPEIRVLLAHPPERMRPGPAVAMGLGLYKTDQWIRRRVHPGWPRRFGFRPRVVNAASCASADELADLILQSSCLPPLMPVLRREGDPVVDGAVVASVPTELVSEYASTLVLLTRRYRKFPNEPGVEYLQPSEPIPIAIWDYANPDGIQAAYDLGRRDGETFARERTR
jgi:predicted acylesterase/phospholipase RssA